MRKKAGIRRKLMSYLAIVGVLCTLVVIFSNFMVSSNLRNSRDFFDCSQNLLEFYDNVVEMDYYAREYLYDCSAETYQSFDRLFQAARSNLDAIARTVDAMTA